MTLTWAELSSSSTGACPRAAALVVLQVLAWVIIRSILMSLSVSVLKYPLYWHCWVGVWEASITTDIWRYNRYPACAAPGPGQS